jgi:hypothetical protein
MTPSTTAGRSPDRPGRLLAGLIRARLTATADRMHAAGDARARAIGWAVTTTPGPFGLSGRSYRDPRFSTLQPGPGDCSCTARPGPRPAGGRPEQSGA